MKNAFKLGALALVVAVSFSACGDGKKTGSKPDSTATTTKVDSTVKVDSAKKDTTVKTTTTTKDTTKKM